MSKYSFGTIKSKAEFLRPLPEYLQTRPYHRSYKGPPIPAEPQPELTEEEKKDRDRELMAKVCRNLQAQFGPGTVAAQSTYQDGETVTHAEFGKPVKD